MKRILIAFFCTICLCACGQTEGTIEGTWRAAETENTAAWEFANGTATVLAGDQEVISGPYTLKDDVLTVTIADWAEPATFGCKVTEKKMTLTQEGVEDKLVFYRVEE